MTLTPEMGENYVYAKCYVIFWKSILQQDKWAKAHDKLSSITKDMESLNFGVKVTRL